MNRRRFFGALGAGAALALAHRSARSQAPQDSTKGAADPLMRPDWVGSKRAEVQAADNDETVKALERKLRCTCGCGLDIFTCRTTDFTCTYSPALHRELVGLLQNGRTPEQAVGDFVAKYGESVLMAPKAEGFGALGYVLPAAAILAAGSVLTLILVRRSRLAAARATAGSAPGSLALQVPATKAPVQSGPPGAAASPEEMARLERALREFDT